MFLTLPSTFKFYQKFLKWASEAELGLAGQYVANYQIKITDHCHRHKLLEFYVGKAQVVNIQLASSIPLSQEPNIYNLLQGQRRAYSLH